MQRSITRRGNFIADAKALSLTPQEYANKLVTEYGSVLQASMKTGYTPNTFHYWRGAKAKQVIQQRNRLSRKQLVKN